ncbi:protein STAY-GREEN 1, chloroplastic-like [Abrus precatorius]|uniref:Protein STAY-GREEN 1, chloroplastic-like n=1 Tax=Abrus precatorius TaxID=3816 RepID=A0A8B8K1Y9_ABRPR|nr:protein STAY-GREEN 1, chloroplastic-like [Abrus precatorius]
MSTLTTAFVPSKFKLSLLGHHVSPSTHRKKNQTVVPVARLFGPAIFEASKLKVLFLGVSEMKHPADLPRTYTLTHCDITSKITLAISHTINNSQEKCVSMFTAISVEVIFCKELPVVLKAFFIQGDENLFEECWGPLKDACSSST